MTLIIPNTFQPGTIAKAGEVNDNFKVVYDKVNSIDTIVEQSQEDIVSLENSKANKNGSNSERFSCADPQNDHHAINKNYFYSKIKNSNDIIYGLTIEADQDEVSINVSKGVCYDGEYEIKLDDITNYEPSVLSANTKHYVYIEKQLSDENVTIVVSIDGNIQSTTTTKVRQIGYLFTDSNSKIRQVSYYGIPLNMDMSVNTMFELIQPDYSGTIINVPIKKSDNPNVASWKAPCNGWLLDTNDYIKNISINRSTATSDRNVYNIIALLKRGDVVWSTSATSATYHFLPCKGVR